MNLNIRMDVLGEIGKPATPRAPTASSADHRVAAMNSGGSWVVTTISVHGQPVVDGINVGRMHNLTILPEPGADARWMPGYFIAAKLSTNRSIPVPPVKRTTS